MKVSELIKRLENCDPEAEVWLPNINSRCVKGYCVLDHVMTFKFSEIENDVVANPGEIDERLLMNKTDESPVVYLGSMHDFVNN